VPNSAFNAEAVYARLTLESDRLSSALGIGPLESRSFVVPSIITCVLYCVLYLPGVVANFLWLRSAREQTDLTGSRPEGAGCLVAMIWLFFWIPLVLGVIVVAAVVALGWYSSSH
jgi:hypothetical protein